METILEAIRVGITLCLVIVIFWQVREIKNLHGSKAELHKKIVEMSADKILMEEKLKKTEKERDDNGYKILSMQKALSDFKKSLKVK